MAFLTPHFLMVFPHTNSGQGINHQFPPYAPLAAKATFAIPEKQHDKLSSQLTTGVHLGLTTGKKAFTIFNPTTCRVHESCNIHLFEGALDSKCVTIKIPRVDSPSHVVEMMKLNDKGEAGADGAENEEGEAEVRGDHKVKVLVLIGTS